MRKILVLILLSSLLILQSCFIYGKKEMLSVNTVIKRKKQLNSTLSSVNISNNQITINGAGFSKTTTVKIKGNGIVADLNIDSKSDSQIIVTATSALSLLVEGTFDLIIGTADAQATYAITFTLQNGAVQANHLSSMGATAGQVLKYNGTFWVPTSQIDVQNYLGTWDALTIIPDVSLTSPGDYYIVSVAGGGYSIGDWIISDGYNWQKIPYSKTSVSSFQGRKGIVTLVPSDYVSLKDNITSKVTGSKLSDIADLDLTALADGQVLKWNQASSKWLPANDLSGSSGIALTDLSASSPLSYNSGTGTFSLPAANVLALPLTGITMGTGAIVGTDSILGAFGKLMSVPTDYVSKSTGATIVTGTIAVSGTGMITIPTATGVTATEAANVTYVNNAIATNASNFTIDFLNYLGSEESLAKVTGTNASLGSNTSYGLVASNSGGGAGLANVDIMANNKILPTNWTGKIIISHRRIAWQRYFKIQTSSDNITWTDRYVIDDTATHPSGGFPLVETVTWENTDSSLFTTPQYLRLFYQNNAGSWTYSGTLRSISLSGVPPLYFSLASKSSSAIFESSAGNVGIGTTAPLSKLDVSGGVAIGSYAGVLAAPSNGLIVSGNIGVGVIAPAHAIDVNGTVNATSLMINGVPVGTSTSSYWSQSGNDISYSGGKVMAGASLVTTPQTLSINASTTYSSASPLDTGGFGVVFIQPTGNYTATIQCIKTGAVTPTAGQMLTIVFNSNLAGGAASNLTIFHNIAGGCTDKVIYTNTAANVSGTVGNTPISIQLVYDGTRWVNISALAP
jgi:hypothetical protein